MKSDHKKVLLWIWVALIAVGFFVVGYGFVTGKSKEKQRVVQSAAALRFGPEYINATSTWSLYTNDLFRFTLNVPPYMSIRHSVHEWDKDASNYDQYVISFSDESGPLGMYAIFNITVTETLFTSVIEYVSSAFSPKNKYVIGEQSVPGGGYEVFVRAIEKADTIPESHKEHRLLVIRNGFLFDIMMRNIPIEYIDQIWNSFRFLDDGTTGDPEKNL